MSNHHGKAFGRFGPRWFAAAGIVALVAGLAGEAGAQIGAVGGYGRGGYGRFGWGGWGGTNAVAAEARGLGALAEGVGEYNMENAAARRINVNAYEDLSNYLYESRMMQRQRYAADQAKERAIEDQARAAIEQRKLENPTLQDIESGSALNDILFEIDNPQIPTSVLNEVSKGATLPGAAVQAIPFMFAHRGTAISLDRLTTEGEGWPTHLRTEQFAPLRERYQGIIKRVMETPEDQPVPPEAVSEARDVLRAMYKAIYDSDLPGPEAAETLRYLKAQAGMVAMLNEPDVVQALEKAGEVDEIALSNLLEFMQVFNLQFGAAKSPEEETLYRDHLYPMFNGVREGLLAQYDGNIPGLSQGDGDAQGGDQRRASGPPTGAFDDLDWKHLGIDDGSQQPAGANPANPPADARPSNPPSNANPPADANPANPPANARPSNPPADSQPSNPPADAPPPSDEPPPADR